MVRTLIAFVAVGGAVAALVASALDMGPLPMRAQSNCTRDVWPEKDVAAVRVGLNEYQVYRIFGRKEGWPPFQDVPEPQRCIAFRYDEAVLGHPMYLSVRFTAGQVSGRWLGVTPFAEPECTGLSRKLIDLKGYYHAAACW